MQNAQGHWSGSHMFQCLLYLCNTINLVWIQKLKLCIYNSVHFLPIQVWFTCTTYTCNFHLKKNVKKNGEKTHKQTLCSDLLIKHFSIIWPNIKKVENMCTHVFPNLGLNCELATPLYYTHEVTLHKCYSNIDLLYISLIIYMSFLLGFL